MKKLFSFLVVIISIKAQAIVDMKTANFADTWTDLVVPGSGYDLKIQRTYNSRTIYSGIFGFGWCSDFESRLEITPEGALKIVECGAGAEVIYTPKKFDGKRVDETVEAILAEVKRRNPSINQKTLSDIKNDLRDDDMFREEFARRVGVKGAVSKDTVYYASGRENETLVKQADNSYKRTLSDGTYQLYGSSGNLTHMYDRNGNYLKLTYDGDLLSGVSDNNGRRLTFIYNKANKKVAKITGPNKLQVTYTTKGEDLVAVKASNNEDYRYEYDDVHNLTKIQQPDGKSRTITYNKDKDWVTAFTNTKGCVESYDYKVNPEDPKNHFWSTVTKKCGGEVTNRSSYEFYHRSRQDGLGVYLYRVRSDNNGNITDITYHEVFGKPVTIIRGSSRTDYTYFENGLVKTKREPGRELAFEYKNLCAKVSRVDIDYFDPVPPKDKSEKIKIIKKTSTTFTYDPKKCNLAFAENSDGQKVKLQYDGSGRIAIIEDQSKKLVKIKYDEKYGKPEVVTRPGLGTIKVSYKPDGEINNVESKDGPRVAVQVASIFNNLLEIIAPASAEANL